MIRSTPFRSRFFDETTQPAHVCFGTAAAAAAATHRPSRRADGGDGADAGAVRGRLHGELHRRLRDAAVGDGGERGGGGPGLPDQDARHAQADGATRGEFELAEHEHELTMSMN